MLAATIRWGQAGELLVLAAVVMGSPGPATLSLTAAGSAFGVRRSLAYLAGIVGGTIVVLLAVAAGLTAVITALPSLRDALIVAAAVYIVWLAVRIAAAPPLARASAAGRPSLPAGAFLGVANPKAWVAIAAVFASARLSDARVLDAALKVAILGPMVVVINVAWLLAGASLAPVLADRRRARAVNVGLALVLVASVALTLGRAA